MIRAASPSSLPLLLLLLPGPLVFVIAVFDWQSRARSWFTPEHIWSCQQQQLPPTLAGTANRHQAFMQSKLKMFGSVPGGCLAEDKNGKISESFRWSHKKSSKLLRIFEYGKTYPRHLQILWNSVILSWTIQTIFRPSGSINSDFICSKKGFNNYCYIMTTICRKLFHHTLN